MERRKVVITGIGFITSIGLDRASVARSLRQGTTGITPYDFGVSPDLSVKVAAPVRGFSLRSPSWRDWTWPAEVDVPRDLLRGLPPHGVYAFCAIEQALRDAKLTTNDIIGSETGLFSASAGSAFLLHHHLGQMEAQGYERGHPLGVVSSISGTLNFNLAAHYRITGGVAGFISACSSSTHALGYACDEIRLGRQQRVIVVGAEELNAETVLPFAAMRALSTQSDPQLASRPFDTGRDGFVGTGGATALILEDAEYAAARGASTYAEIAGWGQAADGYSVATSHPVGAGLALAIRRACADAQVTPSEIDYVHAHATSTPAGDRSEALALQTVFSSTGLHPAISSTKGLTGHGLSMAGTMETGFCALAMQEGFIPGNAHLREIDPACSGLELPRHSLEKPPRVVLKNSSGFGGSNVCLVLKSTDEP